MGVVLYLMAALFRVNLIDFSDGMGGGRFQQTLSLICDGTYCTGCSSEMYYAVMSLKSAMFAQHSCFLFCFLVTSANPEYTGTCLRSEVQCINPTDFRVHNRILFWFFFAVAIVIMLLFCFFLLLLLLFDFFSKDSEHWKF